jgi:hypothetical protein
MAQQCGLAALPGAGQEHGGKCPPGLQDFVAQESLDIRHLRILKCHFRFLKSRIRALSGPFRCGNAAPGGKTQTSSEPERPPPATVYADAARTTPLSNPVIADAQGRFTHAPRRLVSNYPPHDVVPSSRAEPGEATIASPARRSRSSSIELHDRIFQLCRSSGGLRSS